MKKFLALAVFLLNLLSLTEVSAQNYSSETGLVALLNKIVADAMHSDADIYAIVIDGLGMNLKTARLLNCKCIYIVGPDGTVYIAKRENPSDHDEYYKIKKCMKKIIFIVTTMVFLACNADNNIFTTSMLNGTIWSKEDKYSMAIIEFTPTTIKKKTVFKDNNDSVSSQWPYYLTDTICSRFDTNKVGISNRGSHITYRDNYGVVFSKEIIKLNEDSLVLFWKAQKEFIGGRDHTTVLKRMK